MRVSIPLAILTVVALMAVGCGGASPTATQSSPTQPAQMPGEQTATQPKLLYFYADW